jgi:hypothetical protein
VRLGLTLPPYDVEFDWDIAEIQSRWSGNVLDHHSRTDEYEVSLAEAWEWERDECRSDAHYPDVVLALQTYGFVRPLTAYMVDQPGHPSRERMVGLCDGHHRLFAAIELGLERVPVVMPTPWSGGPRHPDRMRLVALDSGEWDGPPEPWGEPRPIDWFLPGATRPLLIPA